MVIRTAFTDQAVVPPCAGRFELFDSTLLADHKRAAEFCAACPMRAECKATLELAQRERPMPSAKYGPSGTWAGMLLNPRQGHL